MNWVMKTSSVRVSTRRGERIYRTLEEIPGPLREEILATFESENCQTILIANPEAHDHMVRMMEGQRPAAGKVPAAAEARPAAIWRCESWLERKKLAPLAMALFAALISLSIFWLIQPGK
jgi:hypothetical protein